MPVSHKKTVRNKGHEVSCWPYCELWYHLNCKAEQGSPHILLFFLCARVKLNAGSPVYLSTEIVWWGNLPMHAKNVYFISLGQYPAFTWELRSVVSPSVPCCRLKIGVSPNICAELMRSRYLGRSSGRSQAAITSPVPPRTSPDCVGLIQESFLIPR